MPQDIVEERGYPQLTDQAKRKILGLNLARLHGMDAPWLVRVSAGLPDIGAGLPLLRTRPQMIGFMAV